MLVQTVQKIVKFPLAVFPSRVHFFSVVPACETQASDMCVDGAGAAKRRRERRLRAVLRHERQTVAMELAAALHHSRDGAACDELRPTGTDDSEFREAARCSDGAGAAGPGATTDFPSALTGRF